jgi:hypothetical protein
LLLPLRSPNDLAGYVITIIEIADTRKCRLAFDSIAPRYARSRVPEHVSDVGGKRRIGVDIVPDLAGHDAEPHRQSKNIDQLLAGMSDEVGAENAIGRLIDDDPRPCDGLGATDAAWERFPLSPRDASRLSNRLGNGISNSGQSAL